MATTPTQPLDHEWVEEELTLNGRRLPLWRVGDLDAFLGRMMAQDGQVSDDDIPYYAHLWPAALVLAEAILSGPPLHGIRVLELGCGTGLCGLAAALHGAAHVVLTDLQPGALRLAERNARAWGVHPRVSTRRLDWREVGPAAGQPADLILASDVLYEARFVEPLLSAFQALLRPGASAWLADPGRPHLSRFVFLAERAGLTVRHGPRLTAAEGAQVDLLSVCAEGALPLVAAPWDASRGTGAP